MPHITESQFSQRFATLILAGRNLPKKQLDLNVLYISAILGLDPQRSYSESELNEALRTWTEPYGTNFGLDHVTLRRYLIDAGYIQRDAAGTSYALATTDQAFTFDPSIRQLNLEEVINKAKEERERRKQQYLSR
jgi:hypothetical protein